jgi:glutathione synthase/RimK-type ligase-like ATP-grasp enzyme
LANDHDFAADLVIRQLLLRGVEVHRINTDHLTERAATWSHDAEVAGSPKHNSVWLRQILPEPRPFDTTAEIDEFLVQREQWRSWLSSLESSAQRWVNPLWASRRAENKIVQLRAATDGGIGTPRTIVTNDKLEALRFAENGACVVKALASAYFPFSDSSFMFTKSFKEAMDLDERDWLAQPLIVQQAIFPTDDIRVFVVGERVFAARTHVDQLDWRSDSSAVWRRYEVEDRLARQCVRLVRGLGLTYGALDFVAQGDNLWFLECNQAGEFAFIDRPLELGVVDALTSLLAGDGGN